VVACVFVLVSACGERRPDPGAVTRSSLKALEDGRAKMAAGDFAGAREAFAAAAAAGGLQPDFYCEARLQQAACEARMGDHAEALAVLDELAAGAPDLQRIEKMRAFVRQQRTAGSGAARPPAESAVLEPPVSDPPVAPADSESSGAERSASGTTAPTPDT
jgi:tetratricopeptide (TPR) repeat protein